MKSLTLSIFFLTILGIHGNEMFTSTFKMETSTKYLNHFTQSLETYIYRKQIQVAKLQRSLQRLTEAQASIDFTSPIGDVARLFRFANLVNFEWKSIEEGMNDDHDIHALRLHVTNSRRFLPTQNDTSGLVLGIIRLQTVYNISAQQFAAGDVFGEKLSNLSGVDCYVIGREMFRRNYLRLAYDWFDVSLQKCKSSDCDKMVQDLSTGIRFMYKLSYCEEAKRLANEKMESNSDSMGKTRSHLTKRLETENMTEISRLIAEDLVNKIDNGQMEYVASEIMRNLNTSKTQEMLCQEEVLYTKASSTIPVSKAKCYYIMRMPKLRPLKIEVISLSEPTVVNVYDVLTETEIEKIKQEVGPVLKRSVVHTSDGGKQTADIRSSQSFEPHNLSPQSRKWHDLIETIVSKTLFLDGERFKVTNYGPGGSFENHVDFWQTRESVLRNSATQTNRLVTCLFYMSECKGGSTVFPAAGLKILPKKGSLTLFSNLDRNGDNEKTSMHAGCPIITGSKWIMSRYIHLQNHIPERLLNALTNPLTAAWDYTK